MDTSETGIAEMVRRGTERGGMKDRRSSHEGVCIVDRNRNVISVDRSLAGRFGAPNGLKCHQLFFGRKKPCLGCDLERVLAGRADGTSAGNGFALLLTLRDVMERMGTPGEARGLGWTADCVSTGRLMGGEWSGCVEGKRPITGASPSGKRVDAPNALLDMLEEQRKEIARELHDDTAQSLALVCLKLTSLIGGEEPLSPSLTTALKELDGLTRDALKSLRRNMLELRPGSLDQGLVPALYGLVQETSKDSLLKARLKVSGPERPLDASVETAFFRIAQEALRNAVKHSDGTSAYVSLQFLPGGVKLTISDNGSGFHASRWTEGVAVPGKLGLIGMRERAWRMGANFSVVSQPSEGTTVAVELPATIG